MQWLNPPPQWQVDGSRIAVTAGPKSDFWRKTHYGFVRDSGHFYYQSRSGDLCAQAKITGQYASLYDQAGLMLRADETTWLKCGIEYFGGVQHASVVVTRDFSDWSIVPLPENPSTIWMRAIRRGEAVEIHYSLDGSAFSMLRMAYLTDAETVDVGIMCAAPEGKGFDVLFEGFSVGDA